MISFGKPDVGDLEHALNKIVETLLTRLFTALKFNSLLPKASHQGRFCPFTYVNVAFLLISHCARLKSVNFNKLLMPVSESIESTGFSIKCERVGSLKSSRLIFINGLVSRQWASIV